MNPRSALVASLLVVALGAVAGIAGASTRAAQPQTLRVWLQVDAKGWPDIVNAATKSFEASHPGVTVNVSYLSWPEHLGKLRSALAAKKAPDVVEMATTELTPFMAAGVLTRLQAATFENSPTWLDGLRLAATYNGGLYAVPYYAAGRAAIVRSDYWTNAGITTIPPPTLRDFYADGLKLLKKYGTKDKSFSALYFPGQNWVAATSWVYDFGGSIAVRSHGRWKGTLDSPRSLAGLAELKKDVHVLSRAGTNATEAGEWTQFAHGHVASMIGNNWEIGLILDAKAGKPELAPNVSAFPMPSHEIGRTMPTFLGGSELAIPVQSTEKALAADWIARYTSDASERHLATDIGLVPNTKTLLDLNDGKALLAPFAHAAASSWFVPTAKHWPDVEKAKIMQTMYVQIFSGKKSVNDAAAAASAAITKILNRP